MLFRPRHAPSPAAKIRNLIWPKMGWLRTLKYYQKRTIRIDDSANGIATGLAIGCAISFTPAFGTHLIQSAFFCWLLRGNFLAAFLGTALGNPYTFPFMWWAAAKVGSAIFTFLGFGDFLVTLPEPVGMDDMLNYPLKIYLPMLAGGYVCALVTYPAFYYPFLYMVRGARQARRARIKRKVHKVAREVTGQNT